MKNKALYIALAAALITGVWGCDNNKTNNDEAPLAEAAQEVEQTLDEAAEKLERDDKKKAARDEDPGLALAPELKDSMEEANPFDDKSLSPDLKRAMKEIDEDIVQMEDRIEESGDRADAAWSELLRDAKQERKELRAEIEKTDVDVSEDVKNDIVALRDRLDKKTDEMFEDEQG